MIEIIQTSGGLGFRLLRWGMKDPAEPSCIKDPAEPGFLLVIANKTQNTKNECFETVIYNTK